MIPMNTANIAKIEEERALRFTTEVEEMENYIFAKKWETKFGDTPISVEFNRTSAKFTCDYKKVDGTPVKFDVTEEHWKVVVEHIKAAGYFVYRQWYHNGYYGETCHHSYYVAKAPFTCHDLDVMDLRPEWGTPMGPGRECFKAERL